MPEKLLEELLPYTRMRNPSRAVLTEKCLEQGAKLTHRGALAVWTGERTGRSPEDRFLVKRPVSGEHIWWSKSNRPAQPEQQAKVKARIMDYFKEKDLYRSDVWVGADTRFGRPVTVVTERASHGLFANLIFRTPPEAPKNQTANRITVLAAPGLKMDPGITDLHSDAGVLIDLDNLSVLIFGTSYAGEVKKAVFSVMNYLMPMEGVLPMHCSANVGSKGDVALFFGLSGTGKTSLSADPNRHLLGDDEHGWSEAGVFNFEGGCYAKLIDLEEESEPEIWKALKFGSLLENVVLDEETRIPDFHNQAITENTRGTYPLDHNPLMLESGVAGHPKVIFFLVADAFGVMPPIARLTKEQAMFYFITGYTAKLAGTEVGTREPQATFSGCFAEPFLPLHPQTYAEMLKNKIDLHQTSCFLVNTGWIAGPYGVGKRIPIKYTRAMVNAAMQGQLDAVESWTDPVFGLSVPLRCPGVPDHLLIPENAWEDREDYHGKRLELAMRFTQHMTGYSGVSRETLQAGPGM